ncbi:MAG: DinB family protein [Ferruginibacter sp.]
MKKIMSILTVGFVLLQAFTIAGNELTQEERKAGSDYLKETRDYFTDHVKGLSDAQLDFKAAPDKWSVRQCMEHIALSESFIVTVIDNSLKQPANPEKKSEIKFTEEMLKTALLDRTKKGQAPEPIQPKGKFKTKEETMDAFLKARSKNIDYIETTKDDLRSHITPHPFFGMLDAYQWMILLSAHSKRHTLQIEEVMANPEFPKN